MVVVVFYDLETTDLRPEVDHEGVQIVSIGAVTSSRRARFERYLYPTCRIEPGATRIHGLVRDRNHGDLYSQNSGNYMDAVAMTEGLNDFMQFLYEVSQNGMERVVLVAHNNFKFDMKVLRNNLREFNIDIEPLRIRFADSIRIMRQMGSESGYQIRGNMTLNNCMTQLLGYGQSQIHTSMEDALGVRDIVKEATENMGYRTINNYFNANPQEIKRIQI